MNRSQSLLERADAVTIRDRRPGRPAPPAIFASAGGAWCTDLEGSRYLDLTASSGAVLLGHGDEAVARAVAEAARCGAVGLADSVTVPLVEVAERLVERYPAAERAAFFRTGSEATTAAARLVRAATGSKWILSAGYHGWHDWHLGIHGLGANAEQGVLHFGYHLGALRALLDALPGRVAGVIVSPEPAWVPLEDLAAMSEACAGAEVPFVLDEVMTGLRHGSAGVNGAGVRADVLTLGKGLANGHSLAAVVGSNAILGSYHAAAIGGTYNREVLPLAAARVVLDATRSGAVHARAAEVGAAISTGIVEALHRAGIPVWTGGPPLMFDLVLPDHDCAEVFFTGMFRHGVHMDRTGTQFVTGAHGAPEVDHVAAAAVEVAVELAARFDRLPPLNERRLAAFAREAFGGVAADDPDWPRDVQHLLDVVARAGS